MVNSSPMYFRKIAFANSNVSSERSLAIGARSPSSFWWAVFTSLSFRMLPPSTADLIRHLMDQHGLTRADLVPILGSPSRVSEVLRGKKGLSMAMVQRLRARSRVPADLLLPPPRKAQPRRSGKRAAA